MYVCFLENHVVYTSSFFQMLCIGQLESKERDWVCFWAKRKYKWAEMEKSEGRECKSAQTLLILMMSTHLSTHWQKTTCESFTISVCDWAESLWAAMGNRSMKKVALLLVSESPENILSHLCVESVSSSFWSRCVFWMRTQCLSDWGSHSRAEVHRTVMCGVCLFKRMWMFCHIFFLNDKT